MFSIGQTCRINCSRS